MGFGLSYAAGAGADALQDLLKQKFLEQIQQARLAEDQRQADMQHGIAQGNLALGNRRVDQDDQQFDVTSGQNQQRIDMDKAEQPVKLRFMGAQSANLERQPQKEADDRAHDFELAGLKGGQELQQIEAQGNQQARVAGIRGANSAARGSIQKVTNPQTGESTLVLVDPTTGAVSPVDLPEGFIPNVTNRPVTGSERQTLAFYNRAKEADAQVSQLEDSIAKAGIGSQLQQQYAPNMLQTAPQQQYRQAQRAFTEARLRKESGAAIPQGEYDTDAKTYFAQPGDSPEVRAQKKAARQAVLEGLKFSSGRAYQEFYGDGAKPAGAGAGASEYDYVPGKGLVPRGQK